MVWERTFSDNNLSFLCRRQKAQILLNLREQHVLHGGEVRVFSTQVRRRAPRPDAERRLQDAQRETPDAQ